MADHEEIRIPKNGPPRKFIDDVMNKLENKEGSDNKIIYLSASGNAMPIACQIAEVVYRKSKVHQLYSIGRTVDESSKRGKEEETPSENPNPRMLTVLKIFLSKSEQALKGLKEYNDYGFQACNDKKLEEYYKADEQPKKERKEERLPPKQEEGTRGPRSEEGQGGNRPGPNPRGRGRGRGRGNRRGARRGRGFRGPRRDYPVYERKE